MSRRQGLIRKAVMIFWIRLHIFIRKRNMTVILVSHSMDDIAKYADRIVVMNQGEVMYKAHRKRYLRIIRSWRRLDLQLRR